MVYFLPDYATVKNRGEKSLNASFFLETARLLKIRSLMFHWLGGAMAMFIFFALLAWFPALMMRTYSLDAGQAGKIVGLILIGGIISGPLAGTLADWWQLHNKRGRMLFLGVLLICVTISNFFFYYTLGTSLKLTIILGALVEILTPMAIPLFFTINADVSPPRLRATAMGGNTFFVFLFGGMWGPVIMGALSDHFGGGGAGLGRAGMIVCVAGILSSAFYFFGSKYYSGDSARVKDEVMAEK